MYNKKILVLLMSLFSSSFSLKSMEGDAPLDEKNKQLALAQNQNQIGNNIKYSSKEVEKLVNDIKFCSEALCLAQTQELNLNRLIKQLKKILKIVKTNY